jgi:hypothetical protein
MAQGEDPEFKPQYHKKRKKEIQRINHSFLQAVALLELYYILNFFYK